MSKKKSTPDPAQEKLPEIVPDLPALKLVEDLDPAADLEVTDTEPKGSERYDPFIRRGHRWFKNGGYDASNRRLELVPVADFNLVINAVIERYNHDTQAWDRVIQCYVTHEPKPGVVKATDTFELRPQECVSKRDLQVAIFKRAFCDSYFKGDDEVKSFFVFLNERLKPRSVREYHFFGSIEYNQERYFLVRNALIHVPRDVEQRMWIMAPDQDGFFRLPPPIDPEGTSFISLDPALDMAPVYDLGPVRDGAYLDAMDRLDAYMKNGEFAYFDTQIADNLQEMVAGRKPAQLDGHLVWAYVNAYHLYDSVFKTFYHGLFLYLWGDPSAGKGKLASVLMSYWGLSSLEAVQAPTVRSIENLLERSSQVPIWLDEFKPDDFPRLQYFNLWFEGKTRGTSSAIDRRRNELKSTRSWLFFASNYALRNDENHNHLRTRCIKVLMSADKRGKESALFWLESHKSELQFHSLAAMRRLRSLDPEMVRDMLRLAKKLLKDQVSAALARRAAETGNKYDITDREIQSMSVMVVTNALHSGQLLAEWKQWTSLLERGVATADQAHESICQAISTSTLFDYSVRFLMDSARVSSERDEFSDFLIWVQNALDQDTVVKDFHYGWVEDPAESWVLRVLAPSIYKLHEKDMPGRAVPKDKVLREFETRDPNGQQKVIYIPSQDRLKRNTSRGYAIPIGKLDTRFVLAFQDDRVLDWWNKQTKSDGVTSNLKAIESIMEEEA